MSGNIRADGAITAAGRGQVCIPTASKNQQFRKLKNIPANTICFDCPNTRPTWASTTYGVLLCLDCSAAHRQMGVHITFVRSLDLDEWTQRQIDAMRIGGNDNCKKFFRKHGLTDFHTKTEKKYTSKAAVAYRAELAKLVDAEAAKRGDGIAAAEAANGGANILDSADAVMKKGVEDEARNKLEAARANGAGSSAGTLQPKAMLASQMSGASGRLSTKGTPASTPPVSGGLSMSTNGLLRKPASSSGGPKLVLRKPSNTSASSRLLKKNSSLSSASRLRVNKITTPASSSVSGDDGFEDVATTQKNIENAKVKEVEDKKKREEEDAKLARELQEQLNGLGNGSSGAGSSANGSGAASPAMATATPASTPASLGVAMKKEPPKPQGSAHEQNMKKLSAMNSDFFSGM